MYQSRHCNTTNNQLGAAKCKRIIQWQQQNANGSSNGGNCTVPHNCRDKEDAREGHASFLMMNVGCMLGSSSQA